MPNAKFVKPLFRKPQRYPSGVTNAFKNDPKENFGMLDPTSWNVFFDDFQGQTAALVGASNGWATQILVGTGTVAPISDTAIQQGGTMQIKTSAGATDSTVMTRHATLGQNFVFDPARKLYAEVRFNLDSPTLGEFAFGLVPASTTTLAASMTEGFRIGKTSAVGTFDFKTFTGSSTAKTTTSTLFSSAVYPTTGTNMITLGFAYNGVAYQPNSVGPQGTGPFSAVQFEINTYADLNDTNGYRVQSVIAPLASLPSQTVSLMPCVSYINTSGVARTINVDYVFVAQERFNP